MAAGIADVDAAEAAALHLHVRHAGAVVLAAVAVPPAEVVAGAAVQLDGRKVAAARRVHEQVHRLVLAEREPRAVDGGAPLGADNLRRVGLPVRAGEEAGRAEEALDGGCAAQQLAVHLAHLVPRPPAHERILTVKDTARNDKDEGEKPHQTFSQLTKPTPLKKLVWM